jgi:hypothetical protein
VPLVKVAKFMASICKYLIIEFVPKEDSQVKKLLANRKDVFPTYTKAGFEKAFSQAFTITKQSPVKGSKRTLYLMKVK